MTSDSTVPHGYDTAVFPTSEGHFRVIFPLDFPSEDLLEVEAFLKVLMDSLRRRANRADPNDL